MEEESSSFSFIEDTTDMDDSFVFPQSPKPRKRISITNPKTPFFLRKGPKFDYLNDVSFSHSFKINANPFTTPARRNHVLETQSPAIIPLVANDYRYMTEFEEINVIGQYNDGNICKCLKRFDGMNYTIKEVNLAKSRNGYEAIIKRIDQMSNLMMSSIAPNKHIVKYFTCWKEGNNLYIEQEICDICLKLYIINENIASFSESELLRMMKHILKAIIYLRNNKYYYYEIRKDTIYIHNNIYKLSLFFKELESERFDMINRNDNESMIKDDIINLGLIVYEIINNNNNNNKIDYFMNNKYSIDFLTVYISYYIL